jgi:hypothetical protein
MVDRYRQSYRTALLISCGLYLAACALPAIDSWTPPNGGYYTDDPQKGWHYVTCPGWECLILGWMFVDVGGEVPWYGLAWLANPLALVSVLLLVVRRPTGAAAFGVASLVCGALFLIDAPGRHGHSDMPRDIPRVGAFLWLGSFVALALAAMIRRGSSRAREHAEPAVTLGPAM